MAGQIAGEQQAAPGLGVDDHGHAADRGELVQVPEQSESGDVGGTTDSGAGDPRGVPVGRRDQGAWTALARLVNPVVLVLDEATSMVDTRTDVLVQWGWCSCKGRTSLVIAHRLSTIREALSSIKSALLIRQFQDRRQ
jgi:ABC-type glutathione transport system ATPase component